MKKYFSDKDKTLCKENAACVAFANFRRTVHHSGHPRGKGEQVLANNLKARDFIASIRPDKKGIKLVNFKK